MHITLCVVTELFLKVFFSEHKVLYLSIPCNVNFFQSSTRSGNIEKNPEEGGRGHTPSPRGKEKLFNIFIFVGPSWHHELLVARQFTGDVLYNIYPSLSEDPEKRAE